ncbi:MAG: hydroxymethylbilane synthase [Deltaproteobacteria bacterium]|nr:hydroxymethylbilane synthase [Deltaproteobacteria bacterium]
MSMTLRIGSRPSVLALAQAAVVRDAIMERVNGLTIEIVPISTSGDKMQTASLAQAGGKGLFIRELEQALSERRIDAAVHSMKDLPAVLPQQFRIAAVPPREVPYDVLLSQGHGGWTSLPQGARLGTSSVRRRLEALRLRPDLAVLPLRGNVDSRIRRLRAGDFDAIILAAAGLRRLGLASDDQQKAVAPPAGVISMAELDLRDFVPSGGQGALAVEALRDSLLGDSAEIENALSDLTDLPTLAEVTAERTFLATLGASCVSPVGVNGKADNEILMLRALLFSADGGRSLSAESTDESAPSASSRARVEQNAARLGEQLGRLMLEQGAGELISCG